MWTEEPGHVCGPEGHLGDAERRRPAWLARPGGRGQRRQERKAGSQIFLRSESRGKGVGSHVVISFALLEKKKKKKKPSGLQYGK